jgi:hypothetical protein
MAAKLASAGGALPSAIRRSIAKLTMPNEPTKACSRCHADLPMSDFYRARSKADGRQGYCKRCSIQNMDQSKREMYRLRMRENTALRKIVHRLAKHGNGTDALLARELLLRCKHEVEQCT